MGDADTDPDADVEADPTRSGARGADADGEVPPELVAAVEANPEAVARLLDRLDAVHELLDAVELAGAALDDEMVASLASRGATLGEAGAALSTEHTVTLSESVGANGEELAAGLETLARLQREGTLDDLASLADVAALATAALDDEMVASLSGRGARLGELGARAADPDAARATGDLLEALAEANAEPVERVGPVGLLRALRNPEVGAGLGYLLAVARAVGRRRDAPES